MPDLALSAEIVEPTVERVVPSVPFAARRGSPVVLGALGVLVTLAIWEIASRTSLVSATELPPPSTTLPELVRQLGEGSFWSSIGATMGQWAIGMLITVVIAVPLGLLLGSVEIVWRAFRPTIEFFRPVPGVALIPLAILLWGLSTTSVVFLIVFGSVWSLLVQTMYGAQQVDDGTRDTARSFGLSRVERIRWLLLPSSLPYVATGLRIASATALIVAVSAELVIGVQGIGYDIARAQTAGQVKLMYSLVLASGGLGIVVHVVFSRLERHFLRWHQSQRTEGRA